jgi:U3 small nucleolar RNA-associated protein 14
MRALLFYHEVKAKRLKKIKSKEYRRKLKKAEKRRAGEAGDEGDEEQLRLDLEAAEFERAKVGVGEWGGVCVGGDGCVPALACLRL